MRYCNSDIFAILNVVFCKTECSAYDASCGGTDVVIPYEISGEAVTEIGNQAFREKGLTSVEFPRSVTKVGVNGFFQNPLLKKIIFKDGLTSLMARSFMNPEGAYGVLEFVMLPKTLENLAGFNFSGNSIKQVVIPDSVTTVGSTVFGYNDIKYLKIGNGIANLQIQAFMDNELENIIIPNNVTSIGNQVFAHNPLKKITIGEGLTVIGNNAFSNGYITILGYYNQNFLTEVYIPANITEIRSTAFGTATSDIILRTERTKEDFLANVSTGTQWNGQAQVIDCNGVSIY